MAAVGLLKGFDGTIDIVGGNECLVVCINSEDKAYELWWW